MNVGKASESSSGPSSLFDLTRPKASSQDRQFARRLDEATQQQTRPAGPDGGGAISRPAKTESTDDADAPIVELRDDDAQDDHSDSESDAAAQVVAIADPAKSSKASDAAESETQPSDEVLLSESAPSDDAGDQPNGNAASSAHEATLLLDQTNQQQTAADESQEQLIDLQSDEAAATTKDAGAVTPAPLPTQAGEADAESAEGEGEAEDPESAAPNVSQSNAPGAPAVVAEEDAVDDSQASLADTTKISSAAAAAPGSTALLQDDSRPNSKNSSGADETGASESDGDVQAGAETGRQITLETVSPAPVVTAAEGPEELEDTAPDAKQTAIELTGEASSSPIGERAASRSQASNRVEANNPTQVDPSRFVSRVARAFETAQDRGGVVQLRLNPPELGSMEIRLTVHEGSLTASLETETHSARKLLLDTLPMLRDRLAEHNIRVEKFDVDVRRDSGGQQQQPQSGAEDRQQSPTPRTLQPRSTTTQRTSLLSQDSAALPQVTGAGDNRLDLLV